MDSLASIIINVFSSFLYDKIGIWKDKRAISNFKEYLTEWAIEFEKKNDGTIITTGIFYNYITMHNTILHILEYVTEATDKSVSEAAFLNEQKERLINAIESERRLTIYDKQSINAFFVALLTMSKEFIYENIQPNDRAIFYCIMQSNLNLQTLLTRAKLTERDLSHIQDELKNIHAMLHKKEAINLSDEWFVKQNKEQIKNLGDRYIPELNVPVNTSLIFDGVAKNSAFYNRMKNKSDELIIKIKSTKIDTLNNIIENIVKTVTGFLSDVSIDLDIVLLLNFLESAESILNNKLSDFYSNGKRKKVGNDINQQIYLINDTLSCIEDYINYINSPELTTSVKPYVLINGEGGIGKSHIIAEAINDRITSGSKSLLFLGQHFKGIISPLQEMMSMLGINIEPDIFLQYLNDVAKKQKSRIVIFIDALNEGNGKVIWPNYLAGIVEKIKAFPWLSLVLSIRSEYINFIFENHKELRNELVITTHTGFSNVEYEAIKKYLDFYKIVYMDIPLANQEFRNPLFLRLFCEGNREQTIDLSYINYSDIYSNYIDSINKKIAVSCGYNHRFQVVREVLNSIVQHKFNLNHESNFIPIQNLLGIILEIQRKYLCTSDLLEQLLSEGVLTQNVYYDGQEYINVTYEKLEDYLYSEMLGIEFIESGKDAFLAKHQKIIYNRSILGCFTIYLAENTKQDIFDIFSPDQESVKFAFIESLKWRNSKSITDKTYDYINKHIISDPYEVAHFFDALILTCTKNDYPLNGRRTTRFIFDMPMPERDAFFIPLFNDIYDEEDSSINRLLDWCLSSEKCNSVSPETIELATLMTSTFLITSNLGLRNKTTKAMVSLLTGHIDILLGILKALEDVDDPYVVERLYAVAFGCAVSEQNKLELATLTEYVYETIFNKKTVYPNILLRDYAKNIIDYSKYVIGELKVDLAKVTPPYTSQFPAIPSDEEINKYKYDYSSTGFKDYYWSQNQILSSMKVEYSRDGSPGGYGDFGRYVFQSYFSSWKQLDPNDLRNIALKKIFDMGYDVEIHGEFDRQMPSGRSNYKGRERIGKKYQWIAFYELAAQVSDNFPMQIHTDDHGSTSSTYCTGSFEPNIRNIDPTIYLRIPTQQSGYKKHIHQKLYTMPSEDPNIWLTNFNDLPPFEDLLQLIYNDRKFILLNGWYSWDEEKPLGEKKYQIPSKNVWIHINSYIVKKDQFDKYLNTLSNADFMGRWMPEPHENYQLYNKEYYWSEGYSFFQNPYYCGEEWVKINLQNGRNAKNLEKILIPTYLYLSERSGDSLGEDGMSWYKPCGELFNALNLRYGKEDSVLYNQEGMIVCFDSQELLDENIGFFIDRNAFKEFLTANGYDIFWTFLAEKSIVQESYVDYEMKYPMPHMSGLFYFDSNDKLIGNMKLCED